MLVEYDLSVPPKYVPIWNAAKRIKEDILSVKPERAVYINTAHAHPGIYSDPEVVKALSVVDRLRSAKIHVLVSPIILADQEGSNGLLRLRDEGSLSLRVRQTRGYENDFTVVEGMKRYTYHAEEGSDSLLQPDQRKILNYERFANWEWQLMADAELGVFKSHYESAKVADSPDPLMPALTTDLERIMDILDRHTVGAFSNWTLEQMLKVPGVREQILNH